MYGRIIIEVQRDVYQYWFAEALDNCVRGVFAKSGSWVRSIIRVRKGI